MNDILKQLDNVLEQRKNADPDSSYVASLFDKGMDSILKKVGEEAAETIVAGRLAVVDSRRTTLKQVEQQLTRLKHREQVLASQQETLANDQSAISLQKLQDQRSEIDVTIKPVQARLIEFRDELPKTNVGKILRRALRDE